MKLAHIADQVAADVYRRTISATVSQSAVIREELAHGYTVRPAAQLGIVKKVTITDCENNTSFLWEFGKGIVFPTRGMRGQLCP